MQKGQALLNQKGQALLIVLLSMSVILTIVLSILSRSVTDIAVTTREEEALRAFSAAEAGVEQALLEGGFQVLTGDFEENSSSFRAEVSGFAEGTSEFAYPIEIASGDTATVWFVAHDDNGSLICDATHPCYTGTQMTVCWGNVGTPADSVTTPALEVSVLYAATPGDYSTVRVARQTFDANTLRRASNSFSAANLGCTAEAQSYAFGATVDFAGLGIPAVSFGTQNGLQVAKLRMIYNTGVSHLLGVDAGNILPAQGAKIDSVGNAGESTRRVEVYKLFADLPPIFDSVLFTPSSISK